MSVELVAPAWGWDAAQIAPLPGGLINKTYVVRSGDAPIGVLQRLHLIFAGTVNLDIEAVTAHVARKGLATPRLIRTLDGRAFVEHDGRVWRALTWVDGETVDAVPGIDWAEAGGVLVGRFHRALVDLRHDYVFARAGVHDTPAHLARLAEHAQGSGEAVDLARQILEVARGLPAMPDVPHRHCHGDLKISNLLFGRQPLRGLSVVDLDTVGLSTMAFEIGDAMRSWCNPHKEDADRARFDLDVFAAAIRGFRSVADPITTDDERRSIVVGLETVCVELAARFCVDVFRDDYFGWDPARFPSRRAHNLVRARGQLALGVAVRASRDAALSLVL